MFFFFENLPRGMLSILWKFVRLSVFRNYEVAVARHHHPGRGTMLLPEFELHLK